MVRLLGKVLVYYCCFCLPLCPPAALLSNLFILLFVHYMYKYTIYHCLAVIVVFPDLLVLRNIGSTNWTPPLALPPLPS